jgi:hypothetical protein
MQSSKICLIDAVLSQPLVLKCCNVLMLSFMSIDTSQPDNWLSVFESAKEVLVISFEILIFEGA